jgi:hypothetical protein
MEEPVPSSPPPSEPTNSAPASAPEDTVRKPGFAFDRSDLIALIALVISLLGTMLAYRETSILGEQQLLAQEQQQLALDQKAANVWPYISISFEFGQSSDTTMDLQFDIINDGVGPALISETYLLLDGERIEIDSIAAAVQHAYPQLRPELTYYSRFEDGILRPADLTSLFTLRFQENNPMRSVVTELADRLDLYCCYCSVYGECWRFVKGGWAEPTKECVIPTLR